VVSQLAADPTTRQAVLTIWRRDDLFHDGDKPCTLTIQFLIRNERLHMVVNMRSNDVWLGLAYDAFVFSQLHWTVLNQLNVHHLPNLLLGTYRHHAASLHLYARDLDAARSMSLTAPSTVIPDLPLGLVCPRDFFPDQVADLLLHPTLDQPTDLANVVALNPWYADQMAAVHESLEVRS
jgi:thymidylate synthase